MKKSEIVLGICLLVQALGHGAADVAPQPSFWSRLVGAFTDKVSQTANYATHSTTTTKLDQVLSALRATYCGGAQAVRSTANCNVLQAKYFKEFPTTKNQQVYDAIQKYRTQPAYVRTSAQLCQEEDTFRAARLAHVARSLDAVLGKENALENNLHVPTVAICASGGGWRAMLATGGFYEGLGDLVNVVTYASCLSGSSWYTVPRALGIPAQALKEGYIKHSLVPVDFSLSNLNALKKNPLVMPQSGTFPETFQHQGRTYSKNYFDEKETLSANIMRDFLGGFPLSAISLYGGFLAHLILAPCDDPEIYDRYKESGLPLQARQQLTFSQTKFFVESNNCSQFPLPIATMVSPISVNQAKRQKTKEQYLWAEVTPYEVGFDYYTSSGVLTGAYVPTWASGRSYVQMSADGKKQTGFFSYWQRDYDTRYGSATFNPEPTLGTWLGIFGSAFAFSMTDIARIMFQIDPNTKGIKGVAGMIMDYMSKMPPTGLVGALTPGADTRVFPATLPNYAVMPDTPFYGQNYWTVADAGIASNLPFYPLLKKDRNVDIIIAFDAGSDAITGSSALAQAEVLARQRAIPFPKIASSERYATRNKETVTVFDEYPEGESGPIIVYCPLMGSVGDFSLEECIKQECTTFNFKYDPKSIEGVWNLSKQIGQTAQIEIKKAIERSMYGQTKPVRYGYVGRTLRAIKRVAYSYLSARGLLTV